ncbi:uncharacterized protein LOC131246020 [Magnolia sinica]|uniref:uncharacterized protein LOC131246020 n=1 Tax=Magnolia sinica TaxID=86752 RepID=UPI00265A66B6|nr:uncharacterized protein LOC131246020 [Magnolia sinica]
MAHTVGSRSFAQVHEEEVNSSLISKLEMPSFCFNMIVTNSFVFTWKKRAKNLGGESPDRATLFITTHRKKDGSVVNEELTHVIEMIEELRATQLLSSLRVALLETISYPRYWDQSIQVGSA